MSSCSLLAGQSISGIAGTSIFGDWCYGKTILCCGGFFRNFEFNLDARIFQSIQTSPSELSPPMILLFRMELPCKYKKRKKSIKPYLFLEFKQKSSLYRDSILHVCDFSRFFYYCQIIHFSKYMSIE